VKITSTTTTTPGKVSVPYMTQKSHANKFSSSLSFLPNYADRRIKESGEICGMTNGRGN
jgi:hypothetical protein